MRLAPPEWLRSLFLVLPAALGLSGGPAAAEGLTVFAAASLKTALQEIEAEWEDTTGTPLTVSLAGSSALARQILLGAPADIFISANADWMDRLDAEGLIAAGTRVELLSNRLVLIAHGPGEALDLGPDLDLALHLGEGRLAMALVEAVPAGIYGKAALHSLGLWNSVAPSVAQADNVRAALALVASGAAPLGIVYATDARAEDRVRVAAIFPERTHPPIVYPAAAIAGGDETLAAEFLAFLRDPAARAVFERQGFTMIDE
ncbi:MAG: molybdate ABC transporter substrate-binding protein [Paracoccaceae bacterium]